MKPELNDDDDILKGFAEEMRASLERNRARKAGRGQVVQFPAKLSEWELVRRQSVIDQTWERVIEERRKLERLVGSGCHRGPGDSDWNR